jgi:hypothetical protein
MMLQRRTIGLGYQCPARSMWIGWQGSMNNFCTWWEHHNMDPDMLKVMMASLLTWRNGKSLPPYSGQDQLMRAYDAQQLINCGCFLEGSIARSWLPVQVAYLTSKGSRKSAKTWASDLVQQLWKVKFKMCSTTTPGNTPYPTLIAANILLDHQIASAFGQGMVSVLKEYEHLFLLSLAD